MAKAPKDKETKAPAEENGANNQNMELSEKLEAALARIAELEAENVRLKVEEEANRVLMEAASVAPKEAPAADKDVAVEAYKLFCSGQSDGVFPFWSELDPPTQRLWRDSYQYVADGGKPRTDYEHSVRYLIVAAQ